MNYLFRLLLDLLNTLVAALDNARVKDALKSLNLSDDWPGYILIKTTEAFSESSVQLQLQLYILYAGYGPGKYHYSVILFRLVYNFCYFRNISFLYQNKPSIFFSKAEYRNQTKDIFLAQYSEFYIV